MKKLSTLLLILLLLVMFAGTIVFLYQKSKPAPVSYATELPQRMDIVRKTVASGSIVPRREVALKSQVPGVVDQLFFNEGDAVNSGDLVARIRIIPNMVNLNTAESQLESARISFADAERELKRKTELVNKKVISDVDYERALLDFRLNKQSLEAAQNNLELIREGAASKSGIASNRVYATVSGMVLDIPVKEGTFIIETNSFNEGSTIASIADMSEMIFEGKIDESEVGGIAVGMDLLLTVGALADQPFKAKLEFISPKGEKDQGAVKFDIKAAIELNPSILLRAGYSATADIILEQRQQVLAINEGNLLFDGADTYVEVAIGEQTFERRKVKTGISDSIHIEILEGLQPGDAIRKF